MSECNVLRMTVRVYLILLLFPIVQVNAQVDLYSRDNIYLMTRETKSSKDSTFAFFYKYASKIDSAMNQSGYAEKVIRSAIYKEKIYPELSNLGKNPDFKPDWNKYEKGLKSEFNYFYARGVTLDAEAQWYQDKRDANGLSKYWMQRYSFDLHHNIDTSHYDRMIANFMIYKFVFMQCDDKKLLRKALRFEVNILKIDTGIRDYPDYLDTYANLLYKIGRRKRALPLERKAQQLAPLNAELNKNLAKMENGLATWQR